MAIGLAEAASATGVNRSTIWRAWKAGRISATRADTGQIEVDPAELFRVFPPVAARQGANNAAHHDAQAEATGKNALRDSALEVEVRMLREMLASLRDDRDHWRDPAGKEREERQRLALAAPIAVRRF